VGVTADIAARAVQHREGKGGSFTHRYGLTRLVYLERYDDITDAIAREKAVKKWNRAWKIRAIEEQNPEWHDLFDTLNM
jgi:putative endonuclease